jgi:hypothetical protein
MVSVDTQASGEALLGADANEDRWEWASAQLLAALPRERLAAGERALQNTRGSGAGLREWVSAIAWRGAVCPAFISLELVDVYLKDPEALPLHDCEDCGLPIPVRPSRQQGFEGEPEHVYFERCPACGGRTGWYRYWARRAEHDVIAEAIVKPR